MSAKDYGFFPSELTGTVYLAKRTKSKNLMSQDRRVVSNNEIIAMFEHYLKQFCHENKCTDMVIKSSDGKVIFTATLHEMYDKLTKQ